jgi:hypothetical protein
MFSSRENVNWYRCSRRIIKIKTIFRWNSEHNRKIIYFSPTFFMLSSIFSVFGEIYDCYILNQLNKHQKNKRISSKFIFIPVR